MDGDGGTVSISRGTSGTGIPIGGTGNMGVGSGSSSNWDRESAAEAGGAGEGTSSTSDIETTGDAGCRTSIEGPSRAVNGGDDDGLEELGGPDGIESEVLTDDGSRGLGVGSGDPANGPATLGEMSASREGVRD